MAVSETEETCRDGLQKVGIVASREDNYQTGYGNQNFVPAIVSINYQFGTPGKRAPKMNFIH